MHALAKRNIRLWKSQGRTCVSRQSTDVAHGFVLVEITSVHLQRATWALGRAIRAHKCALIDNLKAKRLATSEAASAHLCANDR
jgi:hypothetical protein